jgi:hypothetical protein
LILRGFLALLIVILPIYIVVSLFTSEGRKRLSADLAALAILIILFSLLSQSRKPVIIEPSSTPFVIQPPPSFNGQPDTGPETFSASTPAWLVLLSSAGVALVISGVLAGIYLLVLRPKKRASTSLERFADRAQEAMNKLQSGGNIRDAIIYCYVRMSQILEEEKGLQRGNAVTPSEFEEILEEKGLPGEPVRNLTRLFEKVRYGDQQLGLPEEKQAMKSLDEIIVFCRNSGSR